MTVSREPGMFPREPHAPGRLPGRRNEARGTTGRGESLAARSDTGVKSPGVGAQGGKDTLEREKGEERREKPAREQQQKTDTLPAQAKPAEKLEPVKVQLEIAHFATDSWQTQTADTAALRVDAESLKAHPDVKIVIVGHCDPRASERHNQQLGLKRAEAVRDFLVAAGIDAPRISVRSDGEKRPISTKPDEFWLDRRVEFEYR
jgi:outer membrane protein OmpA-like peptidoglycan-associated protein